MRAIGYVRVSTAGQAEDGVSLAAQEAKIRAWAEANGAGDVLICRDEGISGGRSDNRPGLKAALEAAGPGAALVAYSLSRLSRSTRDTLEIAEQLEKRGADLVSLSEKIDTTSAAGKMVFRLLAVLAEFERDQVSDRTRAALAYKRTQGQKTGGLVPFGYTARCGRLYPNAKEQTAIGLMAAGKAGGDSLRAICRTLEARGYKRRGGARTWHPEAVRLILGRPSCQGSTEPCQNGGKA